MGIGLICFAEDANIAVDRDDLGALIGQLEGSYVDRVDVSVIATASEGNY